MFKSQMMVIARSFNPPCLPLVLRNRRAGLIFKNPLDIFKPHVATLFDMSRIYWQVRVGKIIEKHQKS